MRHFLFLILLSLFACESAAPPEARGDKLAKSLCACTNELLVLNQQAQTSSDSLAFRNIAAEFEKARACTAKLGVKPEDRAALDIALNTHCPALASQSELLLELLGQ